MGSRDQGRVLWLVTCPRQPGLHLVRDPEHVVARAELPHPRQVAGVGHHHARLALDGLHHEGGSVGVPQLGLQRREVVVLHGDEARHEGAVVAVGGGVRGAGHGGQGPAPEVVLTKIFVKGSALTCFPCSPWQRQSWPCLVEPPSPCKPTS